MRAWLDIHGFGCEVSSPRGPLAAAVRHVLQHLGLPEAERAAAPLELAVHARPLPPLPAPPPSASHEGGYLRTWHLPERSVLRTDAVHVDVRPEAGTATCLVAPEREGDPDLLPELAVGLLAALHLLLRAKGLSPIHAAGLAHGPHGLLLVADSDAGKSTTAFRLVRHGWRFLSDDSVLLRPTPEAVEAVALRRTFGLDLGAETIFPELAEIEERQPSDPAKRSVPVAALYPGQAALRCRPRVLLFPTIEDRATSVLEPISGADALLALAAQSAFATARPGWAAGHLDLLGRLVRQADAYRLHAGRDLLHDPMRIIALLHEVWPEPLLPSRPPPRLAPAP